MNVVAIEKLQTDLAIGIEKRDTLILRSVLIAAQIGALRHSAKEDELIRRRYLTIETRTERELDRLAHIGNETKLT